MTLRGEGGTLALGKLAARVVRADTVAVVESWPGFNGLSHDTDMADPQSPNPIRIGPLSGSVTRTFAGISIARLQVRFYRRSRASSVIIQLCNQNHSFSSSLADSARGCNSVIIGEC